MGGGPSGAAVGDLGALPREAHEAILRALDEWLAFEDELCQLGLL